MAVGPAEFPVMHPVPGVRLGTASAGIKKPGRRDLVVVEIAEGGHTAAVFTRNAFCAAPVLVAREHLAHAAPRYLLINTGNANAGTGEPGLANARRSCSELASLTNVAAEAVLPFSTGVIGEPLPVEKIIAGMPAALTALSAEGWTDAATGIMTTDTRPKGASVQFDCSGHTVTVTGIAKGAGMIKPNMATMLSFVATDASVAPGVLDTALQQAVNSSFNRITVDGDTSTNDACVLIASGQSPAPAVVTVDSPEYRALADALRRVLCELAQAVIRDAEGATKFVTVDVRGGRDAGECLKVAYAIAESPLVKTALFASDPNWGRLLAAIGRAGVEHLDVHTVSVFLNDVLLAERGARAASYREELGQEAVSREDIVIRVELGRGDAHETVWTSDLSHEYVRINAEYRT